MPVGQLRELQQFAQADEEVVFQRSHREIAPVGRRVDAVAGKPPVRSCGIGSPPSRCETSLWALCVIDTTMRAPRPVRSAEEGGQDRVTAVSAPPARSAIWVGGSAGAVSASTPAQPR